ncbi:MAG: anaerobic ribonucleoside-triphosphate reductase activating protein [Chthoniobacteraceae bacterium]
MSEGSLAHDSDLLPVAGIVPMTTVDFPGRIACVIFTQGCPWRCPYCHNAGLRPMKSNGNLPWKGVLSFLEERGGFLDGVVFSGGEPTRNARLPEAIRQIRELGYAIGLHTAGIYPKRLAAVLPLVDWVGLDIKAPLDRRYQVLTGSAGSAMRVMISLNLVQHSGVDFQLRTTVDPQFTSSRDLDDLRSHLRMAGAPEPVIQPARPSLNISFSHHAS